jgi:hypothetical protein
MGSSSNGLQAGGNFDNNRKKNYEIKNCETVERDKNMIY